VSVHIGCKEPAAGTGDGEQKKRPLPHLERDGPVNQVEVEVLEAKVGERLLHGRPVLGGRNGVVVGWEHKTAYSLEKADGTANAAARLPSQSGPNNVLDIIGVMHGVPQLGGHKDVLALDALVKGGLKA